MEHSYRLVLGCPDKVGIVTRVSQFISDRQGWLLEASYHADPDSGWFFMRNEIRASSLTISLAEFRTEFARLAADFGMEWFIHDSKEAPRLVLMASKASHCLSEILYRWQSGDLHCEIPCVISNHDDLRSMVENAGIPYIHIPVGKDNKEQAHDRIMDLIEQHQADSIVLARYMQILPARFCRRFPHRIINIHHSFLPSFVGANPYQKAFDRGVKLVGATCHYVTEELDAGPIIEQDVIRVSHRVSKDDMVREGKDVEKMVLARGLHYHLEDRVFVHGNKTVIFD